MGYLLLEKRPGGGTAAPALCPVLNFHVSNGASVARINWLGDPSPQGVQQSLGLMVNYEYPVVVDNSSIGATAEPGGGVDMEENLTALERNRRSYAQTGMPSHSTAV